MLDAHMARLTACWAKGKPSDFMLCKKPGKPKTPQEHVAALGERLKGFGKRGANR